MGSNKSDDIENNKQSDFSRNEDVLPLIASLLTFQDLTKHSSFNVLNDFVNLIKGINSTDVTRFV